jgi:hypothetical protein
MLNVDGRAHADLTRLAIRKHGMGSGDFHQPDHVRRGIDRRQLFVVMVERVLMLYLDFRLAADADGKIFCHAVNLSNPAARKKKPGRESWLSCFILNLLYSLVAVTIVITVMPASFAGLFQLATPLLRLPAMGPMLSRGLLQSLLSLVDLLLASPVVAVTVTGLRGDRAG